MIKYLPIPNYFDHYNLSSFFLIIIQAKNITRKSINNLSVSFDSTLAKIYFNLNTGQNVSFLSW